MHSHPVDIANLFWFVGWVIAVGVLFVVALRLPLQTRLSRLGNGLYTGLVLVATVVVVTLANVSLSLHDVYFDLTREAIFTPAQQALDVVDQLKKPVKLTYYYQGDDQSGRRAAEVWEVMGRRNHLLQVRTVDPDKEPSLAKSDGLKLYNTAILEAEGRKISVSSTDEIEVAIGIQRALRERVINVCFLEGHKEYPMEAFEFHTHFEGSAGHEHGDSSSAIVQTTDHGVGRLRRLLEGLGYDAQAIIPAAQGAIPPSCSLVINAGPRTMYLPQETKALEAYLQQGGALLLMYDLGFVLEPGLASLMARLGIQFPQQVLHDPKSHYGKDVETLAVTAYDPHPITRQVSMTFFPGVRPLRLVPPDAGVKTTVLVTSSDQSLAYAVQPLAQRSLEPSSASVEPNAAPSSAGGSGVANGGSVAAASHPVVAIAEGHLSGNSGSGANSARGFRLAAVGDADFASNSFIPYMANSDLTLSLVRWLVREERNTAIASRIPAPKLILLSDTQSRWIFLVLEILMPALLLLTGVVVWWRRR